MNGTIVRTTNSGANWVPLTSGTTNDLYEIHFTFQNVGYAAGENGTLLYTVNSGNSWVQLASGTTNTLRSIYFPTPDTGYTVGTSGTIRKTTNALTGIVAVSNTIPERFSLNQNYPNPFNPESKIKFDIPQNSFTQLTVFDAAGRQVKTLVNQELNAGSYIVSFEGHELRSGVYFYKLSAGEFSETRKMILVK
jgi:hypothetical protein